MVLCGRLTLVYSSAGQPMHCWFGDIPPSLKGCLDYRGNLSDWSLAFVQLRILTLPSIFILENLLYVKRNIDTYTTHGNVHQYNTRGRENIRPHYCRLKRSQDGPSFFGSKFFNILPVAVRDLPMNQFKTYVINILVNKAYYNINHFLTVVLWYCILICLYFMSK